MSLYFGNATSDRVNIGSAADLDNLSTFSVGMVFKLTAITATRVFAGKSDTSSPFATRRISIPSDGSSNLRLAVQRSGGSCNYITNDTPLSTNTWITAVITFDLGASAGNLIKMYAGNTGSALSSRAFGTASDSSGTLLDDSAIDWMVGNNTAANVGLPGYIEAFTIWNRVLSQAEANIWAGSPGIVGTGCIRHFLLGHNGTSTQPDLTGSGNGGTVTGATVGNGAPIRISPVARVSLPYVVAAGGTEYDTTVAGASTNAGVITEVGISINSLAGSSTNAGELGRQVNKSVAGSSTNAGSVAGVVIPGSGTVYNKDTISTSVNSGALSVRRIVAGGGVVNGIVQRYGYWIRRRSR